VYIRREEKERISHQHRLQSSNSVKQTHLFPSQNPYLTREANVLKRQKRLAPSQIQQRANAACLRITIATKIDEKDITVGYHITQEERDVEQDRGQEHDW
jgi:hypothetical protein